jgi:hypothetical protein
LRAAADATGTTVKIEAKIANFEKRGSKPRRPTITTA